MVEQDLNRLQALRMDREVEARTGACSERLAVAEEFWLQGLRVQQNVNEFGGQVDGTWDAQLSESA